MFRRALAVTIVLLGVGTTVVAQQVTYVATGGLTYGGMTGGGSFGNTFNRAAGGYFEFGMPLNRNWEVTLLGTSFGPTKNSLGSSAINGSFYTPYYFDARWRRPGSGSVTPLVAFGYAWQRLHFKGTKGWSNANVLFAGFGAEIALTDKGVMMQTLVKPYVVGGNDLGQTSGFEVQVGIGRRW